MKVYHGLLAIRDASNTTDSQAASMPVSDSDPAPVVISAMWSMLAVSTVFLVLRVYCRAFRVRAMWWDDYLLIAGWIFIVASSATITQLLKMGFGTTLDFKPRMHTISTVSDDLNKVALGLTKTSFAVTLLRVATGWQRYLVWFLIISMNGLLAVNAITTWMAACDRIGLDHYEAVLPGCWKVEDSVIVAMVANAYSAIVDFILALLPWKIIMGLQMKRHEKIGVAVAMSLGLLAGIVGVIKIVEITTISGGGDIPYRLSMLFIWGEAEPNTTVIAASIPVLRVLFRDISRTYYGSSSGANGYLRSNPQSQFPPNNDAATVSGTKLGDESSERSILASPSEPKNAIMRTTQIAVEYDARRSHGPEDDNGVFEMVDRLPLQKRRTGEEL
ncbi:hypothetical protein DL546_002653 [Coniochaeta pulveracea]|uniref:Rhodopsin domain-containing protein n=1 Tax=Coniochaeta pulveracea TaxID=177199 RepID=A0A420Y4W3_9PEZI|nr:hypothetical protein DL546_002653 [Coniochaeta pulveracea]